ncbi:DUF6624 domain-containing protein [Chryseobacterium sp. JJR-5R]|uniref:DUF6624 domain-containing protein n=1 Tax=Chryseobacterium sp. JJR-5R TaxID=3093923 RepID=UPI002A7582B2|nr:DUF6624 domain-containing protein [Chryseobacterium sp. JJR-5R]WPO82257.1 DUF6624 domain-containing protein [Chryseobacterium sp. JJR-5R]
MDFKSIAEKIIYLKNADLELRDRLIKTGMLGAGYNEEMKKRHTKNAEILDKIIDHIGYPTAEKVGNKASEAAWLVIQHSISMPDFMRKCLKLLENSIPKTNAEKISMAYLADRIAVFEGRPQLYGTQFDWDENGQLSPNPYDDIHKVNERRTDLGLNLLEDQTIIIRNHAQKENRHPPADLEERNKEMEAWKKSAGWIS